MLKLASVAALVVMVGFRPAFGFDFARYGATDLDVLMAQRRPSSGMDIYPARPLKLRVALVNYGEGCESALLKKAMVAAGVAKYGDALPVTVTQCITVRSGQGHELRMFIQDVVSAFLPKEVRLGSMVTFYAIHVFTAPEGPGLLVNEFLTDGAREQTKFGARLEGYRL
jgi:hypothetical protein